MALNLSLELTYAELPQLPVRVGRRGAWFEALALIDTGADVSLFDSDLAFALPPTKPTHRLAIQGVGGGSVRVDFWTMDLLTPLSHGPLVLSIGLVPGLAKSAGNILGRDFLESVQFGLDHSARTLYLGRA